MGGSQRAKGARGEREFAALCRSLGMDTRRGCQHSGGPDSPDVVGIPGIHAEVKRCETLSLYPAHAQAERDADLEDIPVVFHRRNGRQWLAVLDAETFLRIAQAAGIGH